MTLFRRHAVALGLAVALAAGGCERNGPAADARTAPPPVPPAPARHADFGTAQPSAAARRIADGVLNRNDHHGRPWLIIDKPAAVAYVFDRSGRLIEAAPVLLGLATGDDTAPGVGDKPLSQVKPAERTTAAGRFEAEIGDNLRGEDVLWIDYDSGLSLHRVLRRPERERRLATPTPADNRMSYGCINVPRDFFERAIGPVFRPAGGVVYVLPDTRTLEDVFGPVAVAAPRP